MANLTITDIAALAGVSKKTVSRVLNASPLIGESTRAHVRAVMAEHGYVPNPQARGLALGRRLQAADEPVVTGDARAGAAAAVARLVELGHLRIGLIAGPDDSALARNCELGFLDALADADLDRGPALVAVGDFGFESGLVATRLLLAVSPRPTAILAASDAMAAGAIRAAAEAALGVPGALSVIGFGDSPLAAQLTPALASVGAAWENAGLVERASLGNAP